MKKVRLFLLALATVSFMSFYACGGETTEDATEESTEEVATEEVATEEVATEEEAK